VGSRLIRPWSFLSDITDELKSKAGLASRQPNLQRQGSNASNAVSVASDTGSVISKSVKEALSSSMKSISLTSASLKHKADLTASEIKAVVKNKSEKIKDAAEKARAEKERMLRIKNNRFQIEDAILSVTGTAMQDIPRLNRNWFIAVFPHTIDPQAEEGTDIASYARTRSVDQQEYEVRHGRNIAESSRSAELFPMSKEAFRKLNFHVHLADLTRYVVVDFCVFVEADESDVIRPDLLPHNVSLPSSASRSKERADRRWLPAFRGHCPINLGAVFGPCGGTMSVLLRPNLSEAIYLSRAQAKRVAQIEGLTIAVTLQPVAVPQIDFLRSLFNPDRAPPNLPGHIIDAVLLEKYNSPFSFHGAAVCCACFQDRYVDSDKLCMFLA
jgi:hypothetical protein